MQQETNSVIWGWMRLMMYESRMPPWFECACCTVEPKPKETALGGPLEYGYASLSFLDASSMACSAVSSVGLGMKERTSDLSSGRDFSSFMKRGNRLCVGRLATDRQVCRQSWITVKNPSREVEKRSNAYPATLRHQLRPDSPRRPCFRWMVRFPYLLRLVQEPVEHVSVPLVWGVPALGFCPSTHRAIPLARTLPQSQAYACWGVLQTDSLTKLAVEMQQDLCGQAAGQCPSSRTPQGSSEHYWVPNQSQSQRERAHETLDEARNRCGGAERWSWSRR